MIKENKNSFSKSKGLRLEFRGPNLFWQRRVDCIMSSPNADLIIVSLASPKNAKSPYCINGASLQLSWVHRVKFWNLLEKVVDLIEGIAVLVQSIFGIFDIYWFALNLVKLYRINILHFWVWVHSICLSWNYIWMPVFLRSSKFIFWKLIM